MAKLIPFEIEVCLTTEGMHEESGISHIIRSRLA
jgi:hypothetical protein